MQNYPYLERNTQKLKNHTRRTGLLCKCSHVLWFEIGTTYPTPSSFYLLFPYVLAQLICKKTCTQVKAHKHSLDFLLQDCLYAVKRRQKHNIGHTVAHLVSAVLLSYHDIWKYHPHLKGPVEGMNPLMTLMPQLIFFEVFKLIS